jgi:lysophospholipase L1-like esterase
MISRPDFWNVPREEKSVLNRRDIIMRSYLKARELGDKHVYFIDGMSFNAVPHQYERTVDGVHPNDAGFIRMAEGIGTFIRHILEKRSAL